MTLEVRRDRARPALRRRWGGCSERSTLAISRTVTCWRWAPLSCWSRRSHSPATACGVPSRVARLVAGGGGGGGAASLALEPRVGRRRPVASRGRATLAAELATLFGDSRVGARRARSSNVSVRGDDGDGRNGSGAPSLRCRRQSRRRRTLPSYAGHRPSRRRAAHGCASGGRCCCVGAALRASLTLAHLIASSSYELLAARSPPPPRRPPSSAAIASRCELTSSARGLTDLAAHRGRGAGLHRSRQPAARRSIRHSARALPPPFISRAERPTGGVVPSADARQRDLSRPPGGG